MLQVGRTLRGSIGAEDEICGALNEGMAGGWTEEELRREKVTQHRSHVKVVTADTTCQGVNVLFPGIARHKGVQELAGQETGAGRLCQAEGADFFLDKSTEFERIPELIGQLGTARSCNDNGSSKSDASED